MNPYGFMPHGYCFEWRPDVLWLHILSDSSIAIAYFGISFLLFYVVWRRRAVPFQLLFILFSTFIILCGTTHLFSIWVLWFPNYIFEGAVKAATAVVSLSTLVTLVFVLPKLLETTSSLENLVASSGKQLADANAQLRAQIAARETIESALRQSQKMEAVGQLTGGIAHDFNNMLQAISVAMETLQSDLAENRGSAVSGHIESVRHTVERASSLTHHLLAYARRQPLEPRAVPLDELVRGMQELLCRTLSSPSATVKFKLDLNDGGWAVQCDPNQLENALLNITINARDAMPAGGTLTIRTRQVKMTASELTGARDDELRDFVELVIADTGIGMDEATRLRVFEPFFTTKPVGRGTGLGLSQVYGFVSQSGGLIKVESLLGSGTEVHLYLRRTSEKTGTILTPKRPLPAVTGNARILFVEDEAIVREIAAEYLRRHGFDVLDAEDASSALQLLQTAEAVDLLITDVGLPNGMNGRQLADIIRETAPGLPVLFITGYAGAG